MPTVPIFKASRGILLAFFLVLSPTLLPTAGHAQVARLNQLQTDINYLGQLIAELQSVMRAERGAREGLTSIEQRIGALETELRTLTASLEQIQFTMTQQQQRADRERARLAFRLDQLEAGRSTSTLSSAPTQPAFQVVQPDPSTPIVRTAPAANAPVNAFDPYGAAGLLEEAEIEARTGPVARQYRAAYQLYQQARFAEAEAAFEQFIAVNDGDPLVANASYWLGETFYSRGNYAQAAIQFADGYRKHGASQKGADHLLKLSLSLAELDRVEDACGSLALLSTKYELTQPDVVRRGRDQARALGCS